LSSAAGFILHHVVKDNMNRPGFTGEFLVQ
jgi:hypothetical protein